MALFCKKYAVCEKCRVHFEPDKSARHQELCPEHRRPVVEREDRISRVVDWAKQNWEKLEPKVLEEETERQQIRAQGFAQMAQAQAQAQAQARAQAQAQAQFTQGGLWHGLSDRY